MLCMKKARNFGVTIEANLIGADSCSTTQPTLRCDQHYNATTLFKLYAAGSLFIVLQRMLCQSCAKWKLSLNDATGSSAFRRRPANRTNGDSVSADTFSQENDLEKGYHQVMAAKNLGQRCITPPKSDIVADNGDALLPAAGVAVARS